MLETVQTDLLVTGLNTLYWKGVKLENITSFNIFSHRGKSTCIITVSCDFPDSIFQEINSVAGIVIRKGRK
jgi:hypothetical protein